MCEDACLHVNSSRTKLTKLAKFFSLKEEEDKGVNVTIFRESSENPVNEQYEDQILWLGRAARTRRRDTGSEETVKRG